MPYGLFTGWACVRVFLCFVFGLLGAFAFLVDGLVATISSSLCAYVFYLFAFWTEVFWGVVRILFCGVEVDVINLGLRLGLNLGLVFCYIWCFWYTCDLVLNVGLVC